MSDPKLERVSLRDTEPIPRKGNRIRGTADETKFVTSAAF